jgi:hypothetical protein
MRAERRDRDVHPLGERECLQQTVQLGFALGTVQAEDRVPFARDVARPDAYKMAVMHQPGCGDRLGSLAIADFRLRRSVRHLDLELHQELHDVLLSLRASRSRPAPRLAPVNALVRARDRGRARLLSLSAVAHTTGGRSMTSDVAARMLVR